MEARLSSAAEYVPLAATIRLEAPVEADAPPAAVFDRMLQVVEALAGACEPLALTLLLGCRIPGVPVLEHEPEPRLPAWQLVEAGLPPEMVIRPPDVADARCEEAPALSADSARAWAARALAQDPPAPGLEVTPASLRVSYTRSRASDAVGDTYTVLDGGDRIGLPVERRGDDAWVLAPAHDLLMQPPVSWWVARDDELYAELWVNWSPWLDPQRPEGAGVRRAVERLQASGWTLRAPVYPLDLVP